MFAATFATAFASDAAGLCGAGDNLDDCAALCSLSMELGGRSPLWCKGTSLCAWSGVTCNGWGRVMGLDLEKVKFKGSIEKITHLTELQHLNLYKATFEGGIPENIGQLTSLKHLNLYKTDLNGPLPQSMSNLTDLRYLNMYKCGVTGSIESLAVLTGWGGSLMEANLMGNDVSGTIPGIWPPCSGTVDAISGSGAAMRSAMFAATFATAFADDVAGACSTSDNLDDCAALCSLPFDDSFQQESDWCKGTSLCAWSGVTCNGRGRVIGLDLEKVEFKGSIDKITHLTELQYLNLYKATFEGGIPENIGQLTSLKHLNLYKTDLNGPLPQSMSNLTDLRYLNIYKCGVTGSIESLAVLTGGGSLMEANLMGNDVSGTIPGIWPPCSGTVNAISV